ncbi:MAG: putative endonuclease containing a domain [Gemmatimonadetes bacterium]|nr:putative endonuclease containing a domain [Gemmatimonadota bacterium]
MRSYWVYILASNSRTLYVGVTNDPYRRLQEHRTGKVDFTSRYRITRLVHLEESSNPYDAICREKQLKRWRRDRKIALIDEFNPRWLDLAEGWIEKS